MCIFFVRLMLCWVLSLLLLWRGLTSWTWELYSRRVWRQTMPNTPTTSKANFCTTRFRILERRPSTLLSLEELDSTDTVCGTLTSRSRRTKFLCEFWKSNELYLMYSFLYNHFWPCVHTIFSEISIFKIFFFWCY